MQPMDPWNELVPPPAPRPETGTRLYTLVKFGAREHMEALHRTGRLYMRTLRYFLGIEDQGVRGDRHEGVAMMYQPDQIQLQIGDLKLDSADMRGPVLVSYHAALDLHVYSMFAVTEKIVEAMFHGEKPIDERCLAFGEYAVMLTNTAEFLARVMKASETAGVSIARSLVHYLDPATHHGKVSPFNKIAAYSWQSEFRIVVEPSDDDIFYLDLGSLEDISVLVRSEEVNAGLQVGHEE